MKKKCIHRFKYTKDDLFSVNSIFSKKKCDICGEVIVLERKYKVYVFTFVLILVILLVLTPSLLNYVFKDVSYMAKGMIAVLIFVFIYGYGIVEIMNRAEYKKYEPPTKVGEDVYEEVKNKTKTKFDKIYKKENEDIE